MSDMHFGFGHIEVRNEDGSIASDAWAPNFGPHPDVLGAAFYDMIASARPAEQNYMAASLEFVRPSALRPYDPVLDGPLQVPRSLRDNMYSSTVDGYGVWIGKTAASSFNYDVRTRRRYRYESTVTKETVAMAIGAVAVAWDIDRALSDFVAPYWTANSRYGNPAWSWADVPGTTVGNVFKHAPGTNMIFNLTGEAPFSTGSVEIGGRYDPPVENLAHRRFRIYYGNAGGTGKPTGVSGTNGSVTTSSDTFTDLAGGNHFTGTDDGNHFIKLFTAATGVNRGTFKIISVTDPNNVVTDATAIVQPFTTEAGLDWELVEGPIGEYFWQDGLYFGGQRWIYYPYASGKEYLSYQPLTAKTYNHKDGLYGVGDYYVRECVHDRGCHWWWISRGIEVGQNDLSLQRWVQGSPLNWDPVMRNGKLTNLPGGWASTCDIRSLALDHNDKLWVGAYHLGSQANISLLQIDPRPGGDAANPDVIATFTDHQQGDGNTKPYCGYVPKILVDGSRIWIIAGATGPSEAAISWSDDGGTTWSRISQLAALTGTATATGTAVVGVGTLFTTELDVGDHVKFGAEADCYEVATIADDLNLTLVQTHAGSGSVAIQRGGFPGASAGWEPAYVRNSALPWTSDHDFPTAADFDSEGNLYWIDTTRTYVVKWTTATRTIERIHYSSFPNNPGANQIKSLTVLRYPDVHNDVLGWKSDYDNDIWIGTYTQGMIRIYNGSVSSDPVDFSSPSYTRLRWDLVDSWPATGDLNVFTSTQYNGHVTQDRLTGRWEINFSYRGSANVGVTYYPRARRSTTSAGGFLPLYAASSAPASPAPGMDSPYQQVPVMKAYDTVGNGSWLYTSPHYHHSEGLWYASWVGDSWVDHIYGGAGWHRSYFVDAGVQSADFLGVGSEGGPLTRGPGQPAPTPGKGLRRMHDWFEDLDYGLRIRFNDAGGATQQADEFLSDETSCFVCYVGTGKDNTQEVSQFGMDMTYAPTVKRDPFAFPDVDVENAWTVDGGIDGSISLASSGGAAMRFERGMAEPNSWPRNNSSPQYDTYTNNWTINNPQYKQFGATLRLPDEFEFSADGDTNAGDEFTSQGAHSFDAADVGKSIFIEGATNPGNNGQAVILALIGGDPTQTVQTDKTFVLETGMRWKMRDIPVVHYVGMHMYYSHIRWGMARGRWILYSSKDYGQAWTLMKECQDHNIVAGMPANDGIHHDDGIFWSSYEDNRNASSTFIANTDNNNGYTIYFDLSDLPESSRRRQTWKVYKTYYDSNTSPDYWSHIALYDADFNYIGVPQVYPDRLDPLWDSWVAREWRYMNFTPVGTASATDDGDGDQVTNLITAASETFWTQSGTNDASLLVTGEFVAPASIFSPMHIGWGLRISSAADPGNDGWAIITDLSSDTQVLTDKVFTAEVNTFDWALSAVVPGNRVRFNDATRYPWLGIELKRYGGFVIDDVPSTTTLLMSDTNIPLGIANLPFVVEQHFPGPGNGSTWPWTGTFPDNVAYGYDPTYGTYAFGTPAEFFDLASGIGDATSAADTDGDGRVQMVTLTATNLGTGKEVFAQAGDYITLVSAGMGRRVFEIKTLTRDAPGGGQTEVVVTYDEIWPSDTFDWTISRKRGLKASVRRAIVAPKESGLP